MSKPLVSPEYWTPSPGQRKLRCDTRCMEGVPNKLAGAGRVPTPVRELHYSYCLIGSRRTDQQFLSP